MGVRKADGDINEQAWPGFDDVGDGYMRLHLTTLPPSVYVWTFSYENVLSS